MRYTGVADGHADNFGRALHINSSLSVGLGWGQSRVQDQGGHGYHMVGMCGGGPCGAIQLRENRDVPPPSEPVAFPQSVHNWKLGVERDHYMFPTALLYTIV